MRRADSLVALLLLACAGFVFVETSGYPPALVRGSPGPAFFPRVLASILAILACLLLAVSLSARVPDGAPADSDKTPVRRTVLVMGATALFVALFEHADVFLLLPLLLGSIMLTMGERRLSAILGVTLLFDVFVYVVFYRLFDVPLPTRFF